MIEALNVLVGPDAKGLSASVVSRLKATWYQEYETWREPRLDRDRWVYLWFDGIYSGLRTEGQKLCMLVVIGVTERGHKRFLAIQDGGAGDDPELAGGALNGRGLELPPKPAIGDGALGFWAAFEEVYPGTRHQRCWVHNTQNVLNALPKSVELKAKAALHENWMAATREDAQWAFDRFMETYGPKYPKAVASLEKHRDSLLTFYELPAEHWVHFAHHQSGRVDISHNSPFAPTRPRCVTRNTMLTLTCKMWMCAEKHWRRIRGFNHQAKVIDGIQFKDAMEVGENADSRNAA